MQVGRREDLDTKGRWEKTGELSRARGSDVCSQLRTQDSNVLTAQDTAHVSRYDEARCEVGESGQREEERD